MQANIRAVQSTQSSKAALWLGRIISVLPALFLIFDGVVKITRIQPVIDSSAQLGLPISTIPAIGLLLIACTVLYLIPHTAVLGAVLLTGYLGGAVSTHVRAEEGVSALIFPLVMGALIWGGLFLQERRLRALIPVRH